MGNLLAAASTWISGLTKILQRVVMMLSDVILLTMAISAIAQDWNRWCDTTLHLYGFACAVLCMFDFVGELVHCTMDRNLDQLQEVFRPVTGEGVSSKGLLDDGVELGSLGNAQSGTKQENPAAAAEPSCGGAVAVSVGLKSDKAERQKRLSEMQCWLIVFCSLVSIVFACFAAHDEDCAENVPHLYTYIHQFTYFFILRLGIIVLQICNRTIKNYEDAANTARVVQQYNSRRAEVEMS